MQSKIFAVDGNIGAGKTEVLRELKNRGYVVFEEPMNEWQPLLELRQADPARWCFTFQVCALSHFVKLQTALKASQKHAIVFTERCASSSWVFTNMALSDGFMTQLEYSIFNNLFKSTIKEPDRVFFIKTPPDVCLERIYSRGRKGEELLTAPILSKLDKTYNRLYENKPVTMLNGQLSTKVIVDEIVSLL